MATTLAAVLARAEAVRAEVLQEVRNALPQELAFKPGARWSVREILIHLGNWEELANDNIQQVLRGQPVPEVAIEAYNREALQRCVHMDVDGAIEYLRHTRAVASQFVARLSDEDVLRYPDVAKYLRWTPSHDGCHLYHIRETLARARGQHREAMVHYLGYHRQRILNSLPLELLPAAALEWQPEPGKWSIKQQLIHLAVWGRQAAHSLAEWSHGRETAPPFESGGLDRWNQQQVATRSHWTPAMVLHEFGAAHELLLEVVRRLPDALLTDSKVVAEIEEQRKHDAHHCTAIRQLQGAWLRRQKGN